MKRLSLLFGLACLLCAQTQTGEFTVTIESQGDGAVAVNFNTQAPEVVGFIGVFEYQPARDALWVSQTVFAPHWYRTGGRLVLRCGECVGTYISAQEVTGLGRTAGSFGGENE